MFARPPSKQELELWCLTEDDFSVDIFPENWATVSLFMRLRTQWRTGLAGFTGLDYSPLFQLLDRMRLSEEEHERMFSEIQIMEAAALEEMSSG